MRGNGKTEHWKPRPRMGASRQSVGSEVRRLRTSTACRGDNARCRLRRQRRCRLSNHSFDAVAGAWMRKRRLFDSSVFTASFRAHISILIDL